MCTSNSSGSVTPQKLRRFSTVRTPWAAARFKAVVQRDCCRTSERGWGTHSSRCLRRQSLGISLQTGAKHPRHHRWNQPRCRPCRKGWLNFVLALPNLSDRCRMAYIASKWTVVEGMMAIQSLYVQTDPKTMSFYVVQRREVFAGS